VCDGRLRAATVSPVIDPSWPYGRRPQNDRPVDVLCLGHALVDRLAYASLEEAIAVRLEPGGMTLIDAERAGEIERAFAGWRQVAGGSAANTAVGVASLGGSPRFAGAVGDDGPGPWYASDLEQAGVACTVATVANGRPTGACHVLVSAGGERSMATSLGAAGDLAVATVERAGVDRAEVVYFEGYLLDPPLAAAAVERALELARESSTLVSLTLSDPSLVERHRERLSELVLGGAIDLLFGNEEEVLSLTGAADRAKAVAALRRSGAVAVVTLGAKGAMAITPDGELHVPADAVERVEDTTGAGDLFAAGCLYGLTHGYAVEAALRLGAMAAGEVISHLGARPAVRLQKAAAERSLTN
jgi:sugar/nucleoside kinase (ribokinase family)